MVNTNGHSHDSICTDPNCRRAPHTTWRWVGDRCTYEDKVDTWTITNMDLGLVRRENPDIAITSDINRVRVIMKGQEYTYYYNSRGIQNNEELFAKNYDDIKNINFKYDYFNKNDRSKIIIAEFQIIENQEFDKIEQILYFDIVNHYEEDDEERLTLNIKYTSIHSNGIKYIMNYKNSTVDKDRFIVLEKTKYYIRPISIINANAVINIFFDN